MSEKISRRVFLKATGLAALSVAAAGALGGCGNLSPLPGNVTLPGPGDYQTIVANDMSYDIAVTAMSDEWESFSTQFESDGKLHHYVYIGLYINRPTKDFSVAKKNFSCTCGSIFGFGNIRLNDGATRYTADDTLKVSAGGSKSVPLYIDLGEKTRSSLMGKEFDIKLTAYGKVVTIHYLNPDDETPVISY